MIPYIRADRRQGDSLMASKRHVTSAERRGILIGLAGLAASATMSKVVWATEPELFVIKRVSLLQRKPGMSHEEFVKHWVDIHAPMARACPGIGRYTLTIVKSASTRKDVAPFEIEVDGIAEMWFKSQAEFEAYSTSPATKRLRDDGATFIGREIDFVTEETIVIS
jgi:uncharacterized protein (TIGR02118 family)